MIRSRTSRPTAAIPHAKPSIPTAPRMPQPTEHAHQCVPHPPHRAARHLGASPKPGKREKRKATPKQKPVPQHPLTRQHNPPLPTTKNTKTNQRITSAHQHTQHRQPTNEEQEPRTMHHQRIRTTIFREGLEQIKAKNTGICRGATQGSTMGCAPVGTKGAGQRPSRNRSAAHCTAPSTVSNASVRTPPCPSSACTVRRAPSTPDWPGGRMRSFHGLGAPLRVARII